LFIFSFQIKKWLPRTINKSFIEAQRIPLNDQSKFILFSDCHRSDNSFADDFASNQCLFSCRITMCDLPILNSGMVDELWEIFSKLF
jgi:hypothetical protein